MMNEEIINWSGHKIHVTDSGEGEPLLLVNGLGGNTDMWEPLLGALQSRRTISFDAPGTGMSSTPTYPVPINALAELASAVLDARGIAKADVLGYSYGGAIAQQMAFQRPEHVRRLVLAATNCGLGSIPGSSRALNVLATPFRYYSPTYFERIAEAAYGGVTGRNPAARVQMMSVRRKHPPSSLGYALQIMGGAGWSSRSFLEQIPHETLVICGDDDPLIPIQNAEMLARHIPRAQLDIVPDAGHLFLWDDAHNVGPRICRFVNDAQASEQTPLH
jgi:poly(3-hydroxyalkanoate) depolymerase